MNIENHPCFNPDACKSYGRVHLPVAPRCNIQCNFCNRKFDCVNESRPGVSSGILSPYQAMEYLKKVMAAKKNISVVGIAGPGDPFANPEETLDTIKMVNETWPDMLLCLATNGLNLPDYLDEVAKVNVSHVSITVNAVDPVIGEKIYAWVRTGKKSLSPEKGARLLLERQMESIKGLKERGIIVKVNTIVLPGINDHHVTRIAERMSQMGVDLLNCMPYYPNEGSNFSHLKEPSKQEIAKIQARAKKYIPQMMHCKRCRADAVGMLDDAPDMSLLNSLQDCATLKEPTAVEIPETIPGAEKITGTTGILPYVAIATREGVLINQHLGEATFLSIYDINKDTPTLIEHREMPEPGQKEFRWNAMAQKLADCHLILVSGVGNSPKRILTDKGYQILMVEGLIDEILMAVKNKQNMNHLIKREPFRCDASCSGAGMGCM
ncbi:MAG: nitrogenase cofactor biosynthesis protein NifB [Proteobacteria bacterium]|nr:nitrogenase cofactor biosynthesis protein NifB [Pseudomonadota bacterium]MBU1386615.1 nitrogenase cofactor biosynthesis protein NifB [Pseudomonadota bacterium]MBU1542359.1 nitrogenase cofactor biosynthesis protein NifB [Pseudomonadota bacterium]MBU2429306.1 nitrogenase cofactor biosynthesis protein NifB [Pseudomonadota bacterium]MBU2480205.1 nitrogenase cofactor biosynthesis protein NifB [Pseudomonadota bacterium]